MVSFITQIVKTTHLKICIIIYGKHIETIIYGELAAELWVDPGPSSQPTTVPPENTV